MGYPIRYLTADSAALSTSYRTFDLGPAPESAYASGLKLLITGASTTGQTATVFLSTDSAGDEGLTHREPDTLSYGKSTGTDAWATYDIDRPLIVGPGPVHIYCHVVLSAGTATGCVPYLAVRDLP